MNSGQICLIWCLGFKSTKKLICPETRIRLYTALNMTRFSKDIWMGRRGLESKPLIGVSEVFSS